MMKVLERIKKVSQIENLGLILICSTFCFIGCLEDKLEPFEFFEVELEPRTWTEDYGTIWLNGNISELANEKLDDHGFIWSQKIEELDTPSLILDQFISLGEKLDADPFSWKFVFEDPDATFYFRAYARKGERIVFSPNREAVSLNYSLSIIDATVTNDQIYLIGSISGIENRGKFEEFGYVYSSSEEEPTYENSFILRKDSIKIDIQSFEDTLIDLNFNSNYYIKLYGKNGDNIFYSPVSQVQVNDGWKRMNDLTKPTVAAFGLSNGENGVIGFGCENEVFFTSQITTDISIFGIPTADWNDFSPSLPPFLNAFLSSDVTAFEIDNILYSATGNGKKSSVESHYIRDISSLDLINGSEWVEYPNDQVPGEIRASSVSFVINDKGYVGTGKNDNTIFSDFFEFDPKSAEGEKWKTVEPMPGFLEQGDTIFTGREGAIAFSIGDRGYVGMGRNRGVFYHDFWEFDLNRIPQWEFVGFFPGISRSNAVVFTIDNKAYFGTGFNPAFGDLKDFWEFDPDTKQWTERTPFQGKKRNQAFGFSINDKGYLGGGFLNELRPDGISFAPSYPIDFWQYTPSKN